MKIKILGLLVQKGEVHLSLQSFLTHNLRSYEYGFPVYTLDRLREFVKFKAMNIAGLLVVEWKESISNVGDKLDERVNNAPQLHDKLPFKGVWRYETFLRVGPLTCAHVVLAHSYFKDYVVVHLSLQLLQLPFHWPFDRGKQFHGKLRCQRYVSVATCNCCFMGWLTMISSFANNRLYQECLNIFLKMRCGMGVGKVTVALRCVEGRLMEFQEPTIGVVFFSPYMFDVLPVKGVLWPFDRGK